MFIRGDIISIIGVNNSGKTTLAKYLASTIDKKYIYIDFIHTSYTKLDEIYESNKNRKIVIIFDNYVEMTYNIRRMNLFTDNTNFTIIFVTNYICRKIINESNTVYFAKFIEKYMIDAYYNSIKKYYINKNKFINKINKLKQYGFLCLDKDNRYIDQQEEEIIKI
jgi:ABC-type oligopeptide transport system ATPase subunit